MKILDLLQLRILIPGTIYLDHKNIKRDSLTCKAVPAAFFIEVLNIFTGNNVIIDTIDLVKRDGNLFLLIEYV